MQYVSLESHISGLWCCLNTQLFHKSKYQNDINLVAFERSWLLGNNRKLHFGLTLSINYKIVYFEDLNKPLRKICDLMDTYFDKSIL